MDSNELLESNTEWLLEVTSKEQWDLLDQRRYEEVARNLQREYPESAFEDILTFVSEVGGWLVAKSAT